MTDRTDNGDFGNHEYGQQIYDLTQRGVHPGAPPRAVLMNGGVTLYDDFSRGNAHAMGGFLHCKRDAQKNNPDALDPEGLDPAGYREPVFCRAREDGTIECDNFVVFPYFDDVGPEDGGLFVLPGSHKSALVRPSELFGSIGKMGSSVAGRKHSSCCST